MTDANGHIRYGIEGHVATLRMCRQAKKNALTHAMYAQLAAALADANQDDQVRVVVIAGEGGVFTAGNDLRDFMEHPPTGEDSPVFQVIRQLIYADKPLVAAVEGPAVGIGTTMLLHCDYVAVSESARFSMPFTALGLTAEAGASLLLPQRCGMARASEAPAPRRSLRRGRGEGARHRQRRHGGGRSRERRARLRGRARRPPPRRGPGDQAPAP